MDPFYSRKGLATFLGIRMSVLLDGGSCFMHKFRDIICRKVPVTLDLLEELLEVLLDNRKSLRLAIALPKSRNWAEKATLVDGFRDKV